MVAILLMLIAAENRYQSAMMAPTIFLPAAMKKYAKEQHIFLILSGFPVWRYMQKKEKKNLKQ